MLLEIYIVVCLVSGTDCYTFLYVPMQGFVRFTPDYFFLCTQDLKYYASCTCYECCLSLYKDISDTLCTFMSPQCKFIHQ